MAKTKGKKTPTRSRLALSPEHAALIESCSAEQASAKALIERLSGDSAQLAQQLAAIDASAQMVRARTKANVDRALKMIGDAHGVSLAGKNFALEKQKDGSFALSWEDASPARS